MPCGMSVYRGVIWVPDQVKDFKEYVTKLNGVLGNQEKTNAIISNAVYLTSAGNNDLVFTFWTGRSQSTTSAYTDLMVTWTENLLKVHSYYFQNFINICLLLFQESI